MNYPMCDCHRGRQTFFRHETGEQVCGLPSGRSIVPVPGQARTAGPIQREHIEAHRRTADVYCDESPHTAFTVAPLPIPFRAARGVKVRNVIIPLALLWNRKRIAAPAWNSERPSQETRRFWQP